MDAPIAEALLDQQVARGVGNVYRSEILWACQQHPLAPVSMLARTDMQRVVDTAARVLHARLLYWCPGCQVRRGPRPAPEPAEQREMDPHPAAAKFLSELPWRRRDTLAG